MQMERVNTKGANENCKTKTKRRHFQILNRQTKTKQYISHKTND